jgi:Spy/CpxP family protein refolding chaperone
MNMAIWKTITGTLALGALALAVVATAEAQAGRRQGPGPHAGPGGPMMGALRLLDLSDEQEAAVRDLMQQHRKAMQPILEQQRTRMHQIVEQADTPGTDPASIGRLVIEAQTVRKQMRSEHEKLKQAVLALLTAEQRDLWTKIEAAQQKARTKAGAHRGQRPGWGPGDGFGWGPGGLGPDAPFFGPGPADEAVD